MTAVLDLKAAVFGLLGLSQDEGPVTNRADRRQLLRLFAAEVQRRRN